MQPDKGRPESGEPLRPDDQRADGHAVRTKLPAEDHVDQVDRRRGAALRLPPIACPRCPGHHRDPLDCPPPVRLSPGKYRYAQVGYPGVAA